MTKPTRIKYSNFNLILVVGLLAVILFGSGFLYQVGYLLSDEFNKEKGQIDRLYHKSSEPKDSLTDSIVITTKKFKTQPSTNVNTPIADFKNVDVRAQSPAITLLANRRYTSTPVSIDVEGRMLLLIICANRPNYLKQTLEKVFSYHPSGSGIPIVISQDGYSSTVDEVILAAHLTKPSVKLTHIHHEPSVNAENGYFKLAAHYKYALNQAFANKKIENVIILEEDLVIAPDFFNYFISLVPMLESDPSIMAISAWNDNGQARFVSDPKQLYRSDFFPGLGWMLNKRVWTTLEPIWPAAYWDDWLREPTRRLGRHFIRPEISRTLHIGVRGVSNNEFGDSLQAIKLNDQNIDFSKLDLSYLEKSKWDEYYVRRVMESPLITRYDFPKTDFSEVRIAYNGFDNYSPDSFEGIARWAGIMDNIKAGVPRTAYKGIVSFYKDNKRVHAVPTTLIA